MVKTRTTITQPALHALNTSKRLYLYARIKSEGKESSTTQQALYGPFPITNRANEHLYPSYLMGSSVQQQLTIGYKGRSVQLEELEEALPAPHLQ